MGGLVYGPAWLRVATSPANTIKGSQHRPSGIDSGAPVLGPKCFRLITEEFTNGNDVELVIKYNDELPTMIQTRTQFGFFHELISLPMS